jgi:hypothetical protein
VKREARVKKTEKEEDKNGSKTSTKKQGGGKLGFIEVCGNFKGYFLEQRATHILNH